MEFHLKKNLFGFSISRVIIIGQKNDLFSSLNQFCRQIIIHSPRQHSFIQFSIFHIYIIMID